jgi:hypothetical protein
MATTTTTEMATISRITPNKPITHSRRVPYR